MHASRTLLASLALASAVLLAGCGNSTDPSPSTAAAVSGIPDPCTLLSPTDTIEPILGKDPGTGTMNAEDPEVSKVCLFSSGLVLQIESSDRYDEAVELILAPSTGATTQDLNGVGDEAILADYGGGINQVVARDRDYWVGVTGIITPEQATELATAMLAAL